MRAITISCLLLSLALGGCASGPATAVGVPNLPQAMPIDPPATSYLLAANTYAGDALHKMLLLRMNSGGGILTTTFVSLNNFDETSAFGRVTSQQIGSRIGQYGFRVLESRLAADITLERRTGEFMLTRDACNLLATTYNADAVLVGCYSEGGSGIFVSARVVRLADNVILAAYEYLLPRDSDVAALLGGSIAVTPSAARAVPGAAVHPNSENSVWSDYARRAPAFAAVATPATVSSPASGTPTRASAAGQSMRAPGTAGKPVNPAAPPTPFPGKKKKS